MTTKHILIKEILDAVSGRLLCGGAETNVEKFSIDSRAIKHGEMFIAVKGDRFDGHDFIEEVTRKRACGIIVKEGAVLPKRTPKIVIAVRDTIEALGNIGRLYRNRFFGPVVAVTGSVGKTGTKEFVASVLSGTFKVHKTSGTLNNHIGVPLTLMDLSSAYDASVIELGMNHLGEIKTLAEIVRPDVGIVTDIGPAHLEYLGSVDNIVKAKTELLELLKEDDLAILNKDCRYFNELKKNVRSRLITVGREKDSDFQAVNININKNGCAEFRIAAKPFSGILEIKMPLIGIHNVYSALFATAVGYGLGVKPENIISGLMKVSMPKMRLELIEIAGIKILNDCYNANPMSMASALDTIAKMETGGRKIFVCSDMLELGKDAVLFHEEIGRKAVACGISRIVTIGVLAKNISRVAVENKLNPEYVYDCSNNNEAAEVLARWMEPGDILLVKGSRGNRMEEIIKGIEEYYSTLEKLII